MGVTEICPQYPVRDNLSVENRLFFRSVPLDTACDHCFFHVLYLKGTKRTKNMRFLPTDSA